MPSPAVCKDRFITGTKNQTTFPILSKWVLHAIFREGTWLSLNICNKKDLSLSLLMFRIFADNTDAAFSSDDLAFVAHRFYG